MYFCSLIIISLSGNLHWRSTISVNLHLKLLCREMKAVSLLFISLVSTTEFAICSFLLPYVVVFFDKHIICCYTNTYLTPIISMRCDNLLVCRFVLCIPWESNSNILHVLLQSNSASLLVKFLYPINSSVEQNNVFYVVIVAMMWVCVGVSVERQTTGGHVIINGGELLDLLTCLL